MHIPDGNLIAFIILREGAGRAVGYLGERDGLIGPRHHVVLVWAKVDELHARVNETVNLVPRWATPDRDSLSMEGGEICAKGRPLNVGLSPILVLGYRSGCRILTKSIGFTNLRNK